MLNIEEVLENQFSIEISAPREADDETAFLEFLSSVTEKERFGLLLSVDGEKSFSPEAKRELNLWFKTNKSLLSERCFGFARVDSKAESNGAFASAALKAALPCPYDVFTSKDDAFSWLKQNAATEAVKA